METTEPNNPNPPSPESLSEPNEAAAVVENFIDTYQIQAEWIRFADAKAGAVLTAIAALMGLLIPTFQPWLAAHQEAGTLLEPLALVTVVIFGLWLLFASISGVFAFRCIAPFRQKGAHPAETTVLASARPTGSASPSDSSRMRSDWGRPDLRSKF